MRSIGENPLTCSALFNPLCRNSEDGKYLNHNLHNYVHHSFGWCNRDVSLKAQEEVFDTLKQFDEYALTSSDGNHRLRIGVSQ